MIIKILSIKSKIGVGRVANYIATDRGRIEDYKNEGVFHNLRSTEIQEITKEFQDNYATYGKARANGNHGLHVILSVSPLDKEKMSVEKMDDIVRTYLSKAYPNALSFGTHHQHESHFHSHLLVSSNELMSSKSTRQSREDLRKTHLEMLGYIKEHHSELSTSIDAKNWGKKLHSEKAYYFEKRNPEVILTKSHLQDKVQELFRSSENSKDFYKTLSDEGFPVYSYKNDVNGIVWGEDEKKMRFETLGISKDKIAELDQQYDRLYEIESTRFDELEEIYSKQEDDEPELEAESSNDQVQEEDQDSDSDSEIDSENDLDVE